MKGDLRYYRILFINCRVPIYRLHCIAVAGASKHFTAEASPCIDIRSHQAKSSTKLLNETVYSTRVSTFIIFVIQCVNNSMYCDFIYFLYCIHHRNCTFPCSACRHRSQITDPRSPIPDQACSNRASKQRKPRKRKVAASHRKSTVVCERTKKTEISRNMSLA